MKKIASALVLSVLLVAGGGSAAFAADTTAKSGSGTVSTDRINTWPY